MFPRQQALDPDIYAEGSAGGLDGMTVRSDRARSPWEGTSGNVVLKRRMISWPLHRSGGGMIGQKVAWPGLPLGRLRSENANARARR